MTTISKTQEIVSIAFCVDSNYIQHLTVTLYSICYNLAQGRILHVYVVNNSLTQTEQERLIVDMAVFTNVKVFFIHDANDYSSLAISTSMTQSTYLKFNLPNTLPQSLSKILYIDCDIIASGDISELYDLSPSYLMAVRDTNIYLEKYYNFLFWTETKNGYFNAGVMLMNLDALREIKVTESIVDYSMRYSNLFHWHDQTGFNRFLYDKYEQIHPKYNLLQCIYVLRNMKQPIYDEIEYSSAKKDPVLIHYAGSTYKPWNYEGIGPYKNLYTEYINKTSYKDFILPRSLPKITKKTLNYIVLCILPTGLIRILFHIHGGIFLHKNKKNSEIIQKMIQEKV